MNLKLNDRPVEVEIDMNGDGSRFVAAGYYADGEMEDLTSEELDTLQDQSNAIINALWRG